MVIKIKRNMTGYDKIELNNQINNVKDKILNYPNSIDIGLLEYDVQKLFDTLFLAEERLLLTDVELRKEASIISNDYGSLAVIVDDRLINLSGDDLINFLKIFPSDNIKSIEDITTTPAKYSSDCNSGLINLKLKKGKMDSWRKPLSYMKRKQYA
jgi:hypothetical protein